MTHIGYELDVNWLEAWQKLIQNDRKWVAARATGSALEFSMHAVFASTRVAPPNAELDASTNPVGGYEGGMASERFCGVCWASERFCGASERFCVGSVVGAIWGVIYKMILEAQIMGGGGRRPPPPMILGGRPEAAPQKSSYI